MNAETLFGISNNLAILGWLVLILVPGWKYTRKLIQTGFIPLLLGCIYLFLIIRYFSQAEGGFGSLDGVKSLFNNDYMLLAGWVHYLAFDLWIGCWETGDAKKHGIHRLLLLPCQLMTFMFGPVGLLLYIIIRSIKTKRLFDHDNF